MKTDPTATVTLDDPTGVCWFGTVAPTGPVIRGVSSLGTVTVTSIDKAARTVGYSTSGTYTVDLADIPKGWLRRTCPKSRLLNWCEMGARR